MNLKRRVVGGLGTAAFIALIEIILLGANQIKIASPLSFEPEIWHTPVWSLVAFPVILGVLSFSNFWK